MLTDQKLAGYRFPLSVIGHAVWLYHRYALRYRDVEELLFERGIEVSRESIRAWWPLDEMRVVVGGVTHWLWRAVDEHGAVLDVLLQRHRDTSAATSFFRRLLGEYDVPETVCTDKLVRYTAAIRELPMLDDVDHQQVISAARCNNLIEQRAGVLMGVRSAQDSPTGRHDARNGAKWVSGRSNGRKEFSTCTPESRIFTALPAPLCPPIIADTRWTSPCKTGEPSYSRWPEVQATCWWFPSTPPCREQLARTLATAASTSTTAHMMLISSPPC